MEVFCSSLRKCTQVVENQSEGAAPPRSTPISPEQQEKIEQLLARWHAVQGHLKRAEQISQFTVVPAINELRYAGRMLVAALANAKPDEANGIPSLDDAIIIADQYITNSEHDISDALIYFFQKKADDLNQRFGAGSIIKEYPKYEQLLSDLKEARQLVIASRSNISMRVENYRRILQITDKIKDEYFSLVDGEVLFALEVEHFKARIRTLKIIALLAGLWATIATGIALLT